MPTCSEERLGEVPQLCALQEYLGSSSCSAGQMHKLLLQCTASHNQERESAMRKETSRKSRHSFMLADMPASLKAAAVTTLACQVPCMTSYTGNGYAAIVTAQAEDTGDFGRLESRIAGRLLIA